MSHPKITAIVLSYNGVELTLACLESLAAQDYPALSVLVVDNCSSDTSVLPRIRAAFPSVMLIESAENLGYSGGNNLGMRRALAQGCDAVFLLNNDTLLDPGCVSALAGWLDAHPRAGAVGPLVCTGMDYATISSAGGQIDWRYAGAANAGAGEAWRGQFPERQVDFVNGCGILVTRAAIERAGLLDEDLFMYWEETDWCWRIHKAGFEVWFTPSARMAHLAPLAWGDLSATTLYYLTRNRLVFFARHSPRASRLGALIHAAHGGLRGYFDNRKRRRPAHARAMRAAVLDGLSGRAGKAQPGRW